MPDKRKWRILNVDDNDAGRYAVTKILMHAGFDVIEAANGTDTLTLAADQHPDLVLLDVNLPDMSGFEVCRRLKQDKKTALIPVVHLSATLVNSSARVQGLSGGADGYLVQPIEPEELVATIRSFLRIRNAEMALRESEERYRMLFNSIDEGFCIIEVIFDKNEKPIDYRFLEINPSFEKQTGLIDAKGKRMRELAPKHEEHWFEIYGKIALTGQPLRFVNRAEQLHRWYDVYAFRFNQPEKRQVAILFNDITERKRVEEALKESEDLLKRTGEIAHVGGWELDADTLAVSWTEETYHIHEVPVGQMPLLEEAIHFFHPDERKKLSDAIQHALSTGEGYDMELRFITAKGKQLWTRTICQPQVVDGKTIRLLGAFQDITERKQAEDALKRSEALLNEMGRTAKVGGWEFDAETFEQVWTEETYRIHEVDMSYKPTVSGGIAFYAPSSRPIIEKAVQRAIENGEQFDVELEFITAKGNHRWVHAFGKAVLEHGKTRKVMGIIQDITERKWVEQALAESGQRINFSLESAEIGAWELDLVNHTAWRSLRHDQIFGYEELLPEWTYEMFLDHVILEDRSIVDTKFGQALKNFSDWEFECRIRRKDGVIRWIWAKGQPEFNELHDPKKMFGLVQDITKRKAEEEAIRTFSKDLERKVTERTSELSDANQKLITEINIRLDAEKQLTKTVGEKEALLREVHHRVKNNLQIIISLLNLQSRYMTDEATLSAFRESQNRIKAMALVHEKLYQSTDISKIDLDNYIKFIGYNLLQFFGTKGKGIMLTRDIGDISLAIDTVIPIGLMINELISNSIKYAFPDERKGEISLAIHRQDHTITLIFKDNGVGIPDDFDWRNAKSLGLRLVISLVEQLQGTIELDRSSGTAFTIVVKEKD